MILPTVSNNINVDQSLNNPIKMKYNNLFHTIRRFYFRYGILTVSKSTRFHNARYDLKYFYRYRWNYPSNTHCIKF